MLSRHLYYAHTPPSIKIFEIEVIIEGPDAKVIVTIPSLKPPTPIKRT
jgi:hypothetical protein